MTENAINVKDLKKYAQEWADAELQKDAQKDVQASVLETGAEKLDMSKADLKKYAELYYKYTYKPDAFEKIEGVAEKVDVIKSL